MELFLIYLWLKLDSFINFALAFAGIGFFVFSIALFPRLIENVTSKDGANAALFLKLHNILGVLCVVAAAFAILLPSKTDVAILVGSSIAIDLAKSPEGAKVATLLRGKANELLDAEINKLNPVKK